MQSGAGEIFLGENPGWINEPAVVYSEATKVHNEALTESRLGQKCELNK